MNNKRHSFYCYHLGNFKGLEVCARNQGQRPICIFYYFTDTKGGVCVWRMLWDIEGGEFSLNWLGKVLATTGWCRPDKGRLQGPDLEENDSSSVRESLCHWLLWSQLNCGIILRPIIQSCLIRTRHSYHPGYSKEFRSPESGTGVKDQILENEMLLVS